MRTRLTDAQRQLVEDNMGIARKAALDTRSIQGIMRMPCEDAYAEACCGLCAATRTFDPDKGSFAAFEYVAAIRYIKRAAGYYSLIRVPAYVTERDGYRRSKTIPLDLVEEPINPALHVDEHVASAESLSRCLGLLTDRQAELCRLLLNGYSQLESARIMGVSQQAVSSHLKNIRERLRPMVS